MVELNTMLGLPKDFDLSNFEINKSYTVIKPRERAFPLHLAVLVVDYNWNFYGYCEVSSAVVKDGKTELTFKMITMFSEVERKLYKSKYLEAGKITGEINN